MDSPDFAIYFVPLFLSLFTTLWLFITWIISHIGGWNRLSQSFRADTRPPGPTYHWRSLHGSFPARYNNCINATLAPEGLHLAPMFMFRFAHPPLLIPWHYIEGPDVVGLVIKRTRLAIRTPGISLNLYLPASAAAEVRRRHPQNVLT
jgi:hypothetical protein